MTGSPLRTYTCRDRGGRVLRLAGGIVYRHQEPGADHPPRPAGVMR